MNLSTLVFILLFSSNPKMPEVVSEFHELKNQTNELNFIRKYEKEEEATYLAYVYSIRMKQAEYSLNPIKKLRLFKQNLSKINLLIEKNSENPHLRYVRLVIQEKVPKILQNSEFIKADKEILSKKLKDSDSTNYLNFYIKKYTSL